MKLQRTGRRNAAGQRHKTAGDRSAAVLLPALLLVVLPLLPIDRLADRVLAASPDLATVQFAKGQSLQENRHYEQAIQFFTSAIASKPDMAVAYESRGSCYLQLEKTDAALADLNKAIALQPTLAIAYADRAKVSNEKGKYQEAVQDFTRAIDLSKGKPHYTFYKDRAALYKETGADDKALADFSEAIKLQPDDPWIHYFRACITFKRGKYQEAIADTTAALKFQKAGEKGAFYQLRAKSYDKLGQHDLAKRDREAAQAGIDLEWAR